LRGNGWTRRVLHRSGAWPTHGGTASFITSCWFTPGLKPERTGWQNDPLLAANRPDFLEMVEADAWWHIDSFINTVKEEEPDFQRPGRRLR